VIIADQHYESFSTKYKAPKFVCPVSEIKKPATNSGNGRVPNTKEKKKRNK